MYPRLTVDLQKLYENGEKLCRKAAEKGITDLAFVTKCFCADPRLVQALESLPNPYLADSRIENLKRLAPSRKQKILLRLPMLSEVEDTVQYADISFCSESTTLSALDEAARRQGKTHKIVLMVDMGDLREGVFFRDIPELLRLTEQIRQADSLELFGMAFNVTCYGSVIPTQQTLDDFRALVRRVEEKVGRRLSFVSAGNSSSLELLGCGDLAGFNNMRIGEGLLFGREAAHCHYLPGLHNDVFTLETQIIEAKRKPSYPIGERGVNAFGKKVEYVDRGVRLRLLAAVGQQDIECTDLIPVTPGVEVVGASSDHLILDSTQLPHQVGDIVRFRMNYTAAMRAFTSDYIEKAVYGKPVYEL